MSRDPKLARFLSFMDELPAHQFEAGWSIVSVGLMRAGHWFAVAEWGRFLPPDDCSPRPDYFVVENGDTEREARDKAIATAILNPRWNLIYSR